VIYLAMTGAYMVRWRDANGRQWVRRFDDEALAYPFEEALRDRKTEEGAA
jgi:hypothetical protein